MITLETLPEATAQEVFDQVARHLLTQGKKSWIVTPKGLECRYRGDEGCKCSAGCLIGDDEYKIEFEGRTWFGLVNDGHVPLNHKALIESLQDVHDLEITSEWQKKLKRLAETHELSSGVLKEFAKQTNQAN